MVLTVSHAQDAVGRDTLAQKSSNVHSWTPDVTLHTFVYAGCSFVIALCFVVLLQWWRDCQEHRRVTRDQGISTELHAVESTASNLLIKTTGYVVGW